MQNLQNKLTLYPKLKFVIDMCEILNILHFVFHQILKPYFTYTVVRCYNAVQYMILHTVL